ncbi:mannuronate-specific alginate lyase [Hahella ganghwensis]|uniref:mannuronate-specific alginate lyase n=1 Tax=Hahella ganghwensis TaxID=286420 RepID=UPI00036938D4|nr:mannuronate-specific alginate lyase [Hahella ganghwensis]
MHKQISKSCVLSTFILVGSLLSFSGCAMQVKSPETQIKQLVAPAGFGLVTRGGSDDEAVDCVDLPEPYTESLSMRSKYEGSGKSRADINKKAMLSYKQHTADVRDFEKYSIGLSDKVLKGKPGAGKCLVKLLENWAGADALMNDEVNHIGEAVRKWALACASLSYLKLNLAEPQTITADQKEVIEDWLYDLSVEVQKYYTDRPLKKVNNHDYWAAWAVMSASVALQKQELFDWAVMKYREGVGQIDASGYLPNELRRKQRALEYHNFALQPLVMIAVFADANGLDLASEHQGALGRLTKRVVDGLNDSTPFTLLTGREQKVEGLLNPWSVAWVAPYAATFDSIALADLPELPPEQLKASRLGGNLSRMFKASTHKKDTKDQVSDESS